MKKKEIDIIKNSLKTDEKILWEGRPSLRTLFFYPDVFSSISGFIWLGLAIVWSSIAWDRPVLCISIAVCLLLVSVFLFVKLLLKIIERLNTRYFLTEDTLYVVYKKKKTEIYSKGLSEVNNPTKQIRKSGYGNIFFFADIPPYRKYSDFYLHYLRYPVHTETLNGFLNVKCAEEVYKLLIDLKAKNTL